MTRALAAVMIPCFATLAHAQVRDTHDRSVVPAAIPAGGLVGYTANSQGLVAAVWIPTVHEAGQ